MVEVNDGAAGRRRVPEGFLRDGSRTIDEGRDDSSHREPGNEPGGSGRRLGRAAGRYAVRAGRHSRPPMYGTSAGGTVIVPSAFW